MEVNLEKLTSQEYKFGFQTQLEMESLPRGLSKETIHKISKLKNEPEFILNFRLKAYEQFLRMKEPKWSTVSYSEIDFQDIIYFSKPKTRKTKIKLKQKWKTTLIKLG